MVGKYRIEPYLLSGAVDTLDYILISHGDEDHINGTKELLERQKIGVRIKNLGSSARAGVGRETDRSGTDGSSK